MEYEKIKQLIDDMGDSKLTSIDINFPDGMKISMTKENIEKKIYQVVPSKKECVQEKIEEKNIQIDNNIESKVEIEKEKENEKENENINIVKSPMVGTFYIKPSPTSNPYVEKGKMVKKGDVLCIIEAMKLMNEIESEYDGEIGEIYIKDGEPVEYGQKLFSVI